ncbi:uncharacterized protein LOC115634794 [Scaptodrosophila lebanonensis]|uniref:Uncharacterized protein LOC115625802 n=1 Tax=Drosophila lebanonensis TaxID=7225 RepID=A0A6J2UJH7_DROLE|nr:uncharacterized protein LOC115625802 [Scaptodrosophila lebanonensis]XP_030388561.1 uncharacterized protein LOC115634794 [Scaptodrosophila lebanonensis]
MTLSNTRSSVKVGKDLSEPFDTVRGFRQGDALSCYLFNFLLESVVRKAGVHRGGTIFFKSVQLLAYADDIDIISRTRRGVTGAFAAIEKEAAKGHAATRLPDRGGKLYFRNGERFYVSWHHCHSNQRCQPRNQMEINSSQSMLLQPQ